LAGYRGEDFRLATIDYTRWMRLVLFVALAFAQSLLPKPSTLQHITVDPSTSAATVAKGGVVTLWADVIPKPNIHVYATDREGLTPVTLVLAPKPGITIGKVKYPAAEMSVSAGATEVVPVYRKPFRLAQPITIAPSAKSGEVLTIAGVINYQACDERLCYPTTSTPVSWTVTVK
jgi:cytochrome c biogenesis DsbD-like protein